MRREELRPKVHPITIETANTFVIFFLDYQLWQGLSWALTVGRSNFSLQEHKGEWQSGRENLLQCKITTFFVNLKAN